MSDKSKFVGQPKSAFDFGWMKRVGKMLDALRNGLIVQGDTGKVIYSDGNTIWQIPSSPGGAVTTYQITQLVLLDDGVTPADYFIGRAWNGQNLSGPEVKIAKRIDFRPSYLNEIIDTVNIIHTYTDDNTRTSSDGIVQNEKLWPRFIAGAEMQAALCLNATPVLDDTGNPIQWIDLTERVWLATD